MSNSYFALFDKTGKPASWRFARAALVLWLFSLILPGIYLHSDERGQLGIGMLLVGWLSPLLLNFAWFANPLFLIAASRILSGKRASVIALLSAVLGLDAFRLSSISPDQKSDLVYGLGWGAIAWISSLLLMMAAAGSLQGEVRAAIRSKDRGLEWLKPVALVSLVALVSVAGYLSVRHLIQFDRDIYYFPWGLAIKR